MYTREKSYITAEGLFRAIEYWRYE